MMDMLHQLGRAVLAHQQYWVAALLQDLTIRSLLAAPLYQTSLQEQDGHSALRCLIYIVGFPWVSFSILQRLDVGPKTWEEFGLPTYREPLVTSACFEDTWAWVLPLVKKISRFWRSVGTSKPRTWRWRFRVVTRPNRSKTWVKSWYPRHPNGKREKASSRNTQGTSTVAWQLLHVAAYFGHEDAVKAQKGKGRRPVITWWLFSPRTNVMRSIGPVEALWIATWYLSSFAVWILQKASNTGMLPVQEWVTTSNPQMIWWYSCHSICIHAKLPATRSYTFTKMRRHGTDGWPVKRKAEENPVR